MKKFFLLLSCVAAISAGAQKIDSISIPKGVHYAYCDSATFADAKKLVEKELTQEPGYALIDRILFIGPVLWSRYGKIKSLEKIEGGNMTLFVDKDQLKGKMTQDEKDGKKVWDQLRKEVKGENIRLRKASYAELQYYWAVINFDIEEPLIIVETSHYKYILNLSPKTLKLIWLDQVPPNK